MEGRPTLEKCKSIKERREFEEELRALDPKNVLPTKLRSQRSQPHPGIKDHGNGIDGEDNGSGGSNDHDDGDCDDGDDDAPRLSRPAMRPRLDLSALGDPEEENDDD